MDEQLLQKIGQGRTRLGKPFCVSNVFLVCFLQLHSTDLFSRSIPILQSSSMVTFTSSTTAIPTR